MKKSAPPGPAMAKARTESAKAFLNSIERRLHRTLGLTPKMVAAIDQWATDKKVSRHEAMGLLIKLGLAGGQPRQKTNKKAASRAREMADQEIDRLGNSSLPAEERERRKRRLTKGPSEFREMRGDILPKTKRRNPG